MTQITRQVPVSVASPNLPDKGSQAVNYRIVRQSTQGGDLEGVLNQLTRPVMDGKFIRQGVERREWLVLSKSGRVGSTTQHGGFLAITLRAEASCPQNSVIRRLFSSLNRASHALF